MVKTIPLEPEEGLVGECIEADPELAQGADEAEEIDTGQLLEHRQLCVCRANAG